MNEYPLRDPSGTIRAWSCGECGRTALNQTFAGVDGGRHFAAECCNRRCRECGERIVPQNWGYSCCVDCKRRLDNARELKRWQQAERVPLNQYDGRFVCNEDDATCMYEADDIPWGGNLAEAYRWAWAMKPEKATLDADDVAEQYIESHHEDADVGLDIGDLQRRLDEWVEANPVTSYYVDTSRIVVADIEEDEE